MGGRLTPVAPVAAGAREAGAGYAAAARALSAVPPVGGAATLPGPAELPGLDAAALRAAGLAGLLPGPEAGLALPLALGLMRGEARLWLGPERIEALAAALGLAPALLAWQLDAPPPPPPALGEAAPWQGRQLPLLLGERLAWLRLFWRPDRPPRRGEKSLKGAGIALALQLDLPPSGRLELRARLEQGRLDAVMETAPRLPRPLLADLSEGFAAALARLGLGGELTLRHSEGDHGT
ncbi:MAG: hypothetical protein DI635_12745 [Pseudoxanthomonas suwonensis]|nr:MAG: hypothetical protein DI635_12745 [Pseudoxanthomonas suwonensis]